MILIFLLTTGRSLNQQTHLSFINLDDALDLLWRKMINRTFLGFLPTQDVVGLCTDGIGLVALVEIKLLEFVLLWGFVRYWSRVLLEFPFLQPDVRKGEDLVLEFWVEDDFIEVFAFVDDLGNLFTTIFTDDMDAAEMHLCIPLVINILQLSNGIGPRVLFLMPLQWIHLDHLVSTLPENINPGISINRHDNPQLQLFICALLIRRELDSWHLISLNDLTLLADFPRMQQLDFLLFEVRGDQC